MRTSHPILSLPTLVMLLAGALHAQSGGSIWTTDQSGSVVNGNVYGQKTQVYLRVGPGPNSPCSGGGLPDGDYAFQVTNPSGSVLLSSDAIGNRQVTVTGGVITGTGATGTHTLKNSSCGKVVKLAPFYDSPSSSNEYKVWLTPVNQYNPGNGFFGFMPNQSKTDNFKIKAPGRAVAQSIIEGSVFYDYSVNGFLDPGISFEIPIAGWRVEIWDNGTIEETFTDQDGKYMFIRDDDGTAYDIVEFAPPPGYIPIAGATWLNTNPALATVIASGPNVAGPDFGNVQFGLAPGVGRSKGFWHSQGEPELLACEPTWREVLGTSPENGFLRHPISSADPYVSIFYVPLGVTFPQAFFTFSDWIVGQPTSGHAGYQLSTQVAATILNNTCGFMQGVVYIDRFQTGELQSLEGMLEGAITLLSDGNAGLTGPNDPFSPSPFDPTMSLRDTMLACINEFTTINNTSNLLEPQVVFTTQTASDEFSSPYER